jgi:spermine oxidase
MKMKICRAMTLSFCLQFSFLDLLELGSYTELQGGNIVLPSGYSSILNPLRSSLPPDAILLNCPVKTIKWKRKKTPVTSPSGLGEIPEEAEDDDGNDSDRTITDEPTSSQYDGTVQIVCETNEVFHADHVICTIPLGVLKDSPKLFEPVLPEYKQESISNLLYGTVDKIFLEFERPFLSQDISEILLLWEDEEPGAADESPEHIAKFWFKKIYSFSKINDTLLLGWISGKEAEHMETLDDKTVSDKCTELLKKFLKDPFIPNPKRCVRTSWKSQPYSRGSYTSIAVGASQEDIENISQPLYSNPHQSKVNVGKVL